MRVGLLHRRGGDVHDVELLGERLDDDAELIEVAGEDRLAQRGARQLEPPRAQIGDGRHGGDLDLLLRLLLDVAQQPMLARLGERDRDAFASGAAGAADAMHVRLGRRGHVVVHDVRHVLDVESARGDVGGDEQVRRVGAELLHHAVALLLRQAAVQRLGAIAAAVERLGELVDLGARAAEDDRRRRILHVEHAAERRDLVRAADDVRDLAHARRADPAGTTSRAMRTRTGSLRCLLAIAAMRGGIVAEKSAVCRSAGVASRIASRSSAKPMSSISSASSSTTTCTRVEAQRLAADVIERAARRGDDDVDAALERAKLRSPSLAPP